MAGRMRRVGNCAVLFLALIAAGACAAGPYTFGQAAAKKVEPATGSVTGTLTCADTNAPARLALVTLEPVPADTPAAGEKKKSGAKMNATVKSDLNGRFSMEKVAPGQYYVLVMMPGYLNPLVRFDLGQLDAMTEETRKELAASVPILDVEANQTAGVFLTLERAAEINGTVLFDDGSPAAGLRVQLLRRNKDGKLVEVSSALFGGMGIYGASGVTDDRGHYRMIGASPGEYAVEASLPTQKFSVGGLMGGREIEFNMEGEEGGAELKIYSGSVFRVKDAKTAKVGNGELVSGVDITIPQTGLHMVGGTLTAKRDGHALNNGQVDLLYADDQERVRSAHVAEDGSFAFEYVPEDKYILRVVSGADTEQAEVHPYPDMTVKQDKVIRKYGQAEMPLLVQGDVTGVELAAPDVQPEKSVDKMAQQ